MAAEKKKSKAQIKKEATAAKHDFIANVYETVLKQIFQRTRENRSKMKISINYQNYNRYINFSSYGQSMAVKIYGDGNVEMELEEFCHDKYKEQIFEYSPETELQTVFLHRLEEMLGQLIPEFLQEGELGWHACMDYVEGEGNIELALKNMDEDCSGTRYENVSGTEQESVGADTANQEG